MLTKYQEFLLERQENQLLELINEAYFILSSELDDILQILSDSNDYAVKRISGMFLELDVEDIDTNISYLDITDSNGMVSFLDAEKAEKVKKENSLSMTEVFDKLKGNKVRLGRLIRRVADIYLKHKGWKKGGSAWGRYKFTDEEIEKFVNAFKSAYDFYKGGATGKFEIVSGNKLLFAYAEENYYDDKGTLGGSCMRHEECQSYLEFYIDNNIELLVLWGPNEKVMGRAVIWELTNGKKFMDRVYYNRDSDLNSFRKYAEENKFLYKETNDSKPYTEILTPESDYLESVEMKLEVKVHSVRYSDRDEERYPYTDTLRYYYWREGKLRNWKDSSNYYVELEDTDGWVTCDECQSEGELDCETCEGAGNKECEDCNGYGHTNCEKCDGEGSIGCQNCAGEGMIEGVDGGETECPDCDSDGYLDCKECGTSGHEDCEECDGEGSFECSGCDGDAQVECSRCGGFSNKYRY